MNLRTWIWLGVALLGVVALWLTNYWMLFHESETTRGTLGDMFGAVNSLFSGLAFAGVVVAILVQGTQSAEAARLQLELAREEHRANLREATHQIFTQWWGPELQALRGYFYTDFLCNQYAKTEGWNLKELHRKTNDEQLHLSRLTGFFDQVGWLGAAGLIDVDYVLGPMQHVVRRVWFATEPLIRRARSPSEEWFDPSFRLGFEWLYRRTNEPEKDHATLLGSRFDKPQLFTKDASGVLAKLIRDDELRFETYLREQQRVKGEDA